MRFIGSANAILKVASCSLFIILVGTVTNTKTMTLSSKAQDIYTQVAKENTKLGDLRKIAKEIKRDHELAMELWSSGNFFARQLAVLIMDKKQLSQEVIDQLDTDIQSHNFDERNQLTDWLMANQLTKDKNTLALIASWEHSNSPLQRRVFWYHQARLRWMGQEPPPNTEDLLASIEARLANEQPEVQWAMNFTAGQIGVHEPKQRTRCIAIGEKTGLYKGDPVSRGCTPSYLPEFIAMEASKWKK